MKRTLKIQYKAIIEINYNDDGSKHITIKPISKPVKVDGNAELENLCNETEIDYYG